MSWVEWSQGWIKTGFFISYYMEGVKYYEYVVARDFAHYVYTWHESVAPGEESGPTVISNLLITRGYDSKTNLNRIWQVIFGIRGEVYVYVELPTDIHRHGLPKIPKPTTEVREVSHFEEWMSPFNDPTFITEHFLMRPGYDRMCISIYNPQSITITPKLRFFVNKMITERIGVERAGVLEPAKPRYSEILEKLAKRVVPVRPISLEPIRAPPTPPAGE